MSTNGKYYRGSFDPNKEGDCKKVYECDLNLIEKEDINN